MTATRSITIPRNYDNRLLFLHEESNTINTELSYLEGLSGRKFDTWPKVIRLDGETYKINRKIQIDRGIEDHYGFIYMPLTPGGAELHVAND